MTEPKVLYEWTGRDGEYRLVGGFDSIGFTHMNIKRWESSPDGIKWFRGFSIFLCLSEEILRLASRVKELENENNSMEIEFSGALMEPEALP